jgi:hypothetical protein
MPRRCFVLFFPINRSSQWNANSSDADFHRSIEVKDGPSREPIYAEPVKLVSGQGLTLEPPRNPDGTVKPVAEGILGGAAR